MYEAPHLTDQISWLMGSQIETIFAVGMGCYVSAGDGEDNGIAGFRFKSGSFGAIHRGSSIDGPRLFDTRIIGTKGMLDISHGSYVRLGKNGKWKDISFPFKAAPMLETPWGERDPIGFHGFRAEFEEFVSSIEEDRQPSCTAYDGRASIEAALAVRESHATGVPVNLPLVM